MLMTLTSILTTRVAIQTALVIGAVAVTSFEANASSLRVKLACAGDYYANCSQFSPDSQQTRQCMRAVGVGLSKGCVSALVADGEVSTAEVARYKSSSKTAAK